MIALSLATFGAPASDRSIAVELSAADPIDDDADGLRAFTFRPGEKT
jgi:hypothetical protein